MLSVLKKPIWALTPLRYIGGKSKIVSKFFQYFPVDFKEYREPFLGGGSVFLFMKQVYPEKKFWINDFNKNLFYFWITLQSNAINLQKELLKIKVISG
jgi:DNA adenine methylase